MFKTFSPKPTDINREWYLLDASEASLGRVATVAAIYLQGKHKPGFAPHMDSGDNIVIINAASLKVTGNKLITKKYYRHSGYSGGLKEISLAQQLIKDPTKVIQNAVKGMLPKNKLQTQRLLRLKIYPGSDHAQQAQKPQKLELPSKDTSREKPTLKDQLVSNNVQAEE